MHIVRIVGEGLKRLSFLPTAQAQEHLGLNYRASVKQPAKENLDANFKVFPKALALGATYRKPTEHLETTKGLEMSGAFKNV